MDNTLSKTVFFRCSPQMWQKLEAIAENSVAKNVSDHIRYALEQYIAAHEVSEPQKAPSLPAR